MPTLEEVHGTGDCHICGKPRAKAHDGFSICSYPHGMLPERPAVDGHPEGFWTWKLPEEMQPKD